MVILANTTTTVRVTIGKSLEKTNLSANITLKVEPTGQKEVNTYDSLVGQLTSRDKHLCKDHHPLAQGQSLRQSDEVISFRLNVTRKANEEVHTLVD